MSMLILKTLITRRWKIKILSLKTYSQTQPMFYSRSLMNESFCKFIMLFMFVRRYDRTLSGYEYAMYSKYVSRRLHLQRGKQQYSYYWSTVVPKMCSTKTVKLDNLYRFYGRDY